jgi:hypothetical protein
MRRFPLQGCGSEDHVARQGGSTLHHTPGGGKPARRAWSSTRWGPPKALLLGEETWVVDRVRLASGACHDCRPGAADENSPPVATGASATVPLFG